jgi:plastocyanin
VTTTTSAEATVSVEVGNFSFGGGSLTVTKGTRVRWELSEGSHTVTSGSGGNPDGLFDSGPLASGEDFDHTFDTVGTFNYFCKFHWSGGMVATVTVTG